MVREEDGRVERGCRLHQRALRLHALRRLREAEVACREALALIESALGRKSADAANVIEALARIRVERGDLGDALRLYRRAEAIVRGTLDRRGLRGAIWYSVRGHVACDSNAEASIVLDEITNTRFPSLRIWETHVTQGKSSPSSGCCRPRRSCDRPRRRQLRAAAGEEAAATSTGTSPSRS
jgi:hypothetical protein